MNTFKKMRLIPDHMYERLTQTGSPRQVNLGDEDNLMLTIRFPKEAAACLADTSLPIEKRVRALNQYVLRELQNRERKQADALSQPQPTQGAVNSDSIVRSPQEPIESIINLSLIHI